LVGGRPTLREAGGLGVYVQLVTGPVGVGLGVKDGLALDVCFVLALALLFRRTMVKATIPASTSKTAAPEIHCAILRVRRWRSASRASRR
jgi:hypothetical protein